MASEERKPITGVWGEAPSAILCLLLLFPPDSLLFPFFPMGVNYGDREARPPEF